MKRFDKKKKDGKKEEALPGYPFNVESVAQRFMFFAFCFFSNGSKMGFRDIIQEMSELTRSTQDYLTDHLTYVKSMHLFQDYQLNNSSSALFVLANSMFNCGVALKMSHCTQACYPFFFASIVVMVCSVIDLARRWRQGHPRGLMRLVPMQPKS